MEDVSVAYRMEHQQYSVLHVHCTYTVHCTPCDLHCSVNDVLRIVIPAQVDGGAA